MIKPPIKNTSKDDFSGSTRVALLFDSESHMNEWLIQHYQLEVDKAVKVAKESALTDLQKSARSLFKDIFGKEL